MVNKRRKGNFNKEELRVLQMKQKKYKAIPVNPNNMGKNRVKWTDRIFFDIF